MAESKKFNLKESLREADLKMTGSPEILGKGMLTVPQYVNSMRTNMFTSHLNQFKVLTTAEYPHWFTNCENLVGEYSDGYKKADGELEVVAKIEKYADIVDRPTVYLLFVWNKKKKRYEVIERREIENLVEVFAYQYNNSFIDSLEVGDTVPDESVLMKSTSYDEYMNYGFGKDVRVMFSLDPDTSEDAAKCSKSLAKVWGDSAMNAVEGEIYEIPINTNDFPMNILGEEGEYKVFPDIGQASKGEIMRLRRQYNDQLLHDFRTDMLGKYLDGDVTYYGDGIVTDVEILCNNEELEENMFNQQILKYLNSQTEYYKEIRRICKTIITSGKDYSSDIDYLYKRSWDYIDIESKWKDVGNRNDSTFSNMIVNIEIMRVVGLSKGSKITGRYGNKSVVAKICEDDDMPKDEDGNRIDLILNLLAFSNRTIAAPLFEVSITFITNEVCRRMRELKTLKEREKLMFECVGTFNKSQEKKMKAVYMELSTKEKKEYVESVMTGKLYIHQPPIGEDYPIFYKIMEAYKKFDWIKPKSIYIKKFGRWIKCLQKQYIGTMYVMMLKQTSRKGFSARGMGAINAKGLPERSYKNKAHTELYSTSNIRFGEFESLNFLIGMTPEELALVHAYYRTCIDARKDIGKHVLRPTKSDVFKIDKRYTSRVAEIFAVVLKSLGYAIEIVDEENIVEEIDYNGITEFSTEDKVYLCSEYQQFLYEKLKLVEEEVYKENPDISNQELAHEVDLRMSHLDYVMETSKYKKYMGIFKEDDELVQNILNLEPAGEEN